MKKIIFTSLLFSLTLAFVIGAGPVFDTYLGDFKEAAAAASTTTPITPIVTNRTLAANSFNANNLANQMYSVELVANATDGQTIEVVNVADTSMIAGYTNLKAKWRFEAGGLATDSLGSNTLTLTNTPTESTGKLGGSIHFTRAESESATIASPGADLVPSTGFSVSCWLKLASSPGNDERRQVITLVNASHLNGVRIRNNAGTYVLDTFISTNSADATDTTGSITTPSTDTWYYFAMTQEVISTNIITKIYWNGVLNKTITTAGTTLKTTTSVYIGTENGSASLWDGDMDEMYIWKDYALSQAQITALALAPPSLNNTQIVINPDDADTVQRWTNAAGDSISLTELGQYIKLRSDGNHNWWPVGLVGSTPADGN